MTSLADGSYQTPVERALEVAVGERISAIRPQIPFDIANMPESMLPWIAETFDADMWPGEIGGVELQRLSIADAIFIHRHRGTGAALRRFGERLEVGLSYTLGDRVGTTAPTITIYIHPPSFTVATTAWIEYVTRVVRRLIPGWLTIAAIHVFVLGSETQYVLAGGTHWHFYESEGEIT